MNKITRKNIAQVSFRDLASVAVPLVLIVGVAFWVAYQFVQPAPPASVAMTTGAEGGAYQAYAERYREILARDKITLGLRPSSGSLENLRRLADEASGVSVGFVQSGIGTPSETPGLVSLGGLYYEPLWIFYRGNPALDRLTQLKGRRIAVGPEGSGTRKLAMTLLSANDIARPPTVLLDLGITAAVAALLEGKIDAAFVIAGPQSPAVQELLRADGVRLMSLSHAAAYTRLFPYLSGILLPQGAIDLARNIPDRDVSLVAATAQLIAREDLHPALMSLFMQAAGQVHGDSGLFQRAGEFPAGTVADFPLSDEARRYYKSGPPFLQRYLPFWAAVFVERMMVLLVPIIAILLPIFNIAPRLYAWRVKSRIFRWYAALKQLERDIEQRGDPARDPEHRARLELIDQQVRALKTPLGFSDMLYTLREHVDFVRALINRSPGP